tara:strand:+ start:644 stop:1165 length:522 start_codon:yes stop_codon:yes gene_type:complete
MKSFQRFITELYDKDLSSATRQGGEGGRIRASRKKTEPEKRRVKAVGGGKTAPAKDYKDRKDIGTQRKRSEREQQPTQKRGSASLSPREQQKKARAERLAAKSSGKSKKELTKAADKLLTKKTAKKVDPNYKAQKASGYTRIERQKIARAAKRLTRDMRKGVDKPASHYDPKV